MQNTATAFPYRKHPQGLPSQGYNSNQQKPLNVWVWAKSVLHRSILRAGMKCAVNLGTSSSGDTSDIYQPALRVLWSYSERKPRVTESIRVSGVWIYSERRYQRRSQRFSDRTYRACLWRDGTVRPPVEAGIRH